MVISEELVKEINRLRANKSLVVSIDEALPWLLWESAEDVVVLGVKLDIVAVQIFKEFIGTKDFSDLDQLVRVTISMEERLLAEDHGRKHGPQRPHVERVVVLLVIYQQLWAFEIPRSYSHVVLCSLVIEFCQSPVNESQLVVS